MSAERLREAAALMRSRATNRAVPETRWYVEDDGEREINVLAPDPEHPTFPWDVARDLPEDDTGSPVAEHIASWHPAVALAVADLLDAQATIIEEHGAFFDIEGMGDANALAVANAYLGGAS